MEHIDEIRKHYQLTSVDEQNLKESAEILLPASDQLTEDFYAYLLEDSYTAHFFQSEEVVRHHKKALKQWFRDLFRTPYTNAYLRRLERIGKVHVKIGLKGHYVNAGMNFVRNFCSRRILSEISDPVRAETLVESTSKALDISLDIMTSSYREEELKKVFLSRKVESRLILWSERMLHGLNLILMIGLMAMAAGVAALLGHDIFYAFSSDLENGVIKALGSLLILWMMVELLHTQVQSLRGGKFHVRVFVELALVAFIRKLFVASIEEKEPIVFALFLGGLLVLGVVFYFLGKDPVRRGG